jgi:carboxyl-terminal processing protease
MTRQEVISRRIVLTIVVLMVAFFGGFSYQDILNGVANKSSLAEIVTHLPSNLTLGIKAVADDNDPVSQPLQSYANALTTVQSDYYGSVPVSKDEHGNVVDQTTAFTYSAIRGMMASLNDRYTRFLAPDAYADMQEDNNGEFVGIGAQLDENAKSQIYVVKPLPNSPAVRAHIMAGDVIVKVDNKPTLGEDITLVVQEIRGAPGTPVTLTLLRKTSSHPLNVTIIRNYVQQEVVVSEMLDPVRKIGYIELGSFNEESDPQIDLAMTNLQAHGMRALIFDLRGNPGGLLNAAQDVASRFVSAGPIVWVKQRGMDLQSLDVEQRQHDHPRYPLAVLVNEDSASASEITSGAIKDTKSGVLIGNTTFGKGLVQTIIPLQDKSAVAITTAHYFTPLKKDINHKGILPDIKVLLSDQDERNMNNYGNTHPNDIVDLKYDRQLDAAVANLTQRLANGEHPTAWH